MRRASRFLFACALLAAANLAEAGQVSGSVVDEQGQPIPFVRILVAIPGGSPATVSVWSAADGSFASPPLSVSGDAIQASSFRIGWEETSRDRTTTGDDVTLKIAMKRIGNVAHQVPASAWIPGEPGERAYHTLVHECSNCHQMSADRVRRFASTLAEADEQARTLAWEGIVQMMRGVAFTMGPSGQAQLRWGLTPESPDYQAALAPETSFFLPKDMDLVVPLLAKSFPSSFDELTGYDDVNELGDYGVTKNTVVEEFVLPSFGWTREVAIAPGSPLVWFVELDGDRLGSLDPKTGEVNWYDVPGEGPQGPHTINADAEGGLWIALEESYGIARFDTKTTQWKVYPPPPDVKFAITHDTAFNELRQIEIDSERKIWLTLIGINELWSVHVDSGKIERYPMPLPEDEELFHVFLYGAVMEPGGKRVWWSQLHGSVGAFNTETKEVDRLIPLPQGAAPRRMAIQADGMLWVPLFGEGQLLKLDTNTGEEVARYDLPDRAAASYSVTIDPKRKAIWVGTTNSDRIYRFDIADARWRQYPLPRKEAYLRSIELDHETGDLWTSYANLPVGKRDPEVFGSESANNMIVRLRPGD